MNIIKSLFDNSRKLKELKADFEFLSARYNKLIDMNAKQQADHKSQLENLESALRDAESPIATKALTRLTFSARLPDGTVTLTEFTLGLGRCGKIVESLDVVRRGDLFIIKQWHTDGSHKDFTYKECDIEGRIQECYEVVSVASGTYYKDRLLQAAAWARRHRLIR